VLRAFLLTLWRVISGAAVGIATVWILATSGLDARAQSIPSERSGKQLYDQGCAACHANDGTGAPRALVGFDTPLPDFTDCSFATPEADADWLAVAHAGGPVRAFDRRMPAFGEALSSDELTRIIQYIRGFCTERAWPRGELNLPRALVTEKAFPENEAVYTVTAASGEFGNEFLYERRLGARTQWELVVPIDAQDPGTGWNHGLGDVAVALKHVLFHDLNAGRILSAAGEIVFPTGKENSGLGKGTTRFEPFVSFGQILPSDRFLQAQAGVELSTNRSKAAHEAFWRFVYGRTFFESGFGRAWTPMVELLAARELEDERGVHWDLVPQMQVSLSRRQHILLNTGVQFPLNQRTNRSTRFMAYLLWDWFDGGFFEGWR
jgi:mono/diheme cytochrome c family protein